MGNSNDNQPANNRDLLIGIAAIATIVVGEEAFSLRKSVLGVLLLLFLLQEWSRSDAKYESLLYSFVFGATSLLVVGYFVQEFAAEFGYSSKQEIIFVLFWCTSALLCFVVRIYKKKNLSKK